MKNSESIAVNPDGNIVYLEKHNPYKSKCSEDKDAESDNVQHIRINEEDFYIGVNMIHHALDLEKKAKFVKIICLVDLFVSVMNLGMQSSYALIPCFVSICGYQGAVMYNKSLVMIYMVYQALELIAKVYLLFIIANVNMILFMGLSIGIDIYILREFKIFYHLLSI